jgi:hypothetical protein
MPTPPPLWDRALLTLLRLALNSLSPCLHPPSSCDYRCAPPHPAQVPFRIWIFGVVYEFLQITPWSLTFPWLLCEERTGSSHPKAGEKLHRNQFITGVLQACQCLSPWLTAKGSCRKEKMKSTIRTLWENDFHSMCRETQSEENKYTLNIHKKSI